MNIYFKNASDLIAGIEIIKDDLGIQIVAQDKAYITVEAVKTESQTLKIDLKNNYAVITYGTSNARFYRGLSELIFAITNGESELSITTAPLFVTNGAMLDVSRNAAMNLKYLKFYLKKMALLGLNTFMLYTEDMYEIDTRPYFGHMRGRYSKTELKELDSYASKLGIELVPCIQVLGHLATALRWSAMAPVKDTANALLADCDETYKLIDEMFKTIRECFTSNRIHIGMDETHDLGTGRYIDKLGYRERKEIYFDHLARVTEMAKCYGFKPMMWSDMFFRMSAKNIENFVDYDKRTVLPADIGKYLPNGVQPVFWDYYNPDEEFYAVNIEKHKLLSNETIFAGGIWFWSSHCPHFSRSFRNTLPALDACKKGGVKEVLATIWHNTSLSSLILSLAGLIWYSEYDYCEGNFDMGHVRKFFKWTMGQDYNDFMKAELPEYPHGGIIGISNRITYNDPLIGLIDKHVEGIDTSTYYKDVSNKLADVDGGVFAPAFDVIKKLSSLLENKADFGIRLRNAYLAKDIDTLKAMSTECDLIVAKIRALRDAHYNSWMEYNKPFGWEVHDIRYGGLVMRFETAKKRIMSFVAGEIDTIAELDEQRLRFDCLPDSAPLTENFLWCRFPETATTGIL